MVLRPNGLAIILDTDPGGDDSFALLWLQSLVKQGLAELVAVTTAAGNVAARQTFLNASQLLNLGQLSHIPLGRGVPVTHTTADAAYIHGADGIGNLSATLEAATHDYETAPAADDLLIEKLSAAPNEMTLVAIGPLTNLAAAEQKQPGILRQAKEIVVMAGAFRCPGNVTPQAEFNVWFNPEAAQTVLNSQSNLVMLPLDVTTQLVLTQPMAESIYHTNPASPIAQFLVNLCAFMVRTAASYRETSLPGFLVHDAVTFAYLFYPETLLCQRAMVQVATQGEWTRGQTMMDHRPLPKPPSNVWVALQVDATGFFTRLLGDLTVLVQTN